MRWDGGASIRTRRGTRFCSVRASGPAQGLAPRLFILLSGALIAPPSSAPRRPLLSQEKLLVGWESVRGLFTEHSSHGEGQNFSENFLAQSE